MEALTLQQILDKIANRHDISGYLLEDIVLSGRDCSGLSFAGSVLQNVDFSGAHLADCDFSEATLSKCNPAKARMSQGVFREACFIECDLTAADFSADEAKRIL
mgnify:FL=1